MTQLDETAPTPPASPAPAGGTEPGEQRAAMGRLLLILAAAAATSVLLGVGKTVLVMVAVIAMIMLHELGHFVTAKWAGMKVTEYFLGFGPRLWSVRRGETEYGIKAIPAGGYVRITGMNNLEEVDPADEPRTYRQKGYWRRMSVAVAGSTVHFLIAFVLLWVIHFTVGVVSADGPRIEIGEISALETGESPAQQAGLRPGDRIVSVDGTEYPYRDVSDMQKHIRANPGTALTMVIERDGARREVQVTPVDLSQVKVEGDPASVKGPDEPTGFVGIRMGPASKVESTNPVAAVGRAAGDMGEYTVLTVKALGGLLSFDGVKSYSSQLTGEGPATIEEDQPRFLSPVGLVRLASSTADSGWRPVLFLLVTINIFVGIFNMIPLPPFDGGHVAVATYEAIRSRKGRRYTVDMAKLLPVAYLVVLLLVFLGVTSLYLDIVRPLKL